MSGAGYEERPWGNFKVLSDELDHKVKRIVVNPGCRLSYQTHSRRSEHWHIIKGKATVTVDGVDHLVGPGEGIDIGLGVAHRCANIGHEPVVFIEVQRGDYFGEDDIVRIEDDFGRG